jgi:cell division septum initiation protein DivIVA
MTSEEQRLEEEISELRGELGETVEALVHKVDVPTRAKERGSELAEQAVDRGVDVYQQVVERGSELSERLTEWCKQFQARVLDRGSEMRDQLLGTAERARESASQAVSERQIKLAGVGLALVALMIITRKRSK